MAVLERKAAGNQAMARPFQHHDTLAIADLKAIARAHATFQARSMPYIGNAATLLSPREAYVVHGLVYYIDGLGTVWTMGAAGHQAVVASFPIKLQQQEVSFAVSPDGCHFAATVLTIPAKGPGSPFPSLNGQWKLDVWLSDIGGSTRIIRSQSSGESPDGGGFQNLVLAGWDATGPLVIVGSAIGTQNGNVINNYDFFNGSIAHLGADGTPGPAVSLPASCLPVQIDSAGDITCVTQSSVANALYVVNSSGVVETGPLTVAQNADVAVAAGGYVAVTGDWVTAKGTGTLPANFEPEGWINPTTIFGRLGTPANPPGNAALAHLTSTGATIENLGFKGDYVGMLSA